MKVWRLVLAGALALCSAVLVHTLGEDGSTARAGSGKRVALVIGNSRYPIKPLPSPVKDAAQWKSSLQDAGFEVDLCPDCKLQQMKDKLAAFKAKIAPGDEAFFYYGGHGAEENNINLLFPVDADVQGCGTLFEQSVSLSYVLDAMREAVVKVVVLDACRSSPFPTCTMDNDSRVFGPPKVVPSGTLIAYATQRGDTATDTGQGSAFSSAVLPLAFQPGRPLYDALIEAKPKVQQATGGRQEPLVLSSLSPASYALRPAVSPSLDALLGKLGDPPTGGPTGQTYVALKGTAGEMKFVGLSRGEYDMGTLERVGSDNEHPVLRVWVSAFAIGLSEVTQGQWAAVVMAAHQAKDADAVSLKPDPSFYKGAQVPVESVSWCDTVRFANALSRLERRRPAYAIGTDCENRGAVAWDRAADGYRLPTEAEWEYAARASTRSAYGNRDTEADLTQAHWHGGNSEGKPREVCTADVKPWGLCDMHGNVWEWTWDYYQEFYEPAEVGDPAGPTRGRSRVIRGGSWDVTLGDARSVYMLRISGRPSEPLMTVGVRLVLPVPAFKH